MKIQVIADGSTKWQHMIKRWGLSFLIGDDVLFDTFGSRRVFMSNVKEQNIDLSQIRHIVISHDDWDHIAGLWDVIDKYKDLKVYVGPHFQSQLKDKIRDSNVTLVETPSPIMIRDGVYTTGELAGNSVRGILYEQSLVIKEGTRLSVVTGCAHPQLLYILHIVKEYFHQDVSSVIGGFHLRNIEYDQIKSLVEQTAKLGIKRVAPLHCTGAAAVKEFKRFYGSNCCFLCEGDSIDV